MQNIRVTVAEVLSGCVEHFGVYLVRDPAGVVVYVGCTKDIRQRFRWHRRDFTAGIRPDIDPWAWTVEMIADSHIGWTDLEADLIALLQPMYNEQGTTEPRTGSRRWMKLQRERWMRQRALELKERREAQKQAIAQRRAARKQGII